MKDYIVERVINEANIIIRTGKTVRDVAEIMGVSKSTVHVDVTRRLLEVNPILYHKVRQVLEINKREKHIRGGLATRKRYLRMRKYN